MNQILVATIPTVLVSLITFLLTRKKYRVDVDSTELDNVEKATRIWRELSEELNKRLTADLNALREENQVMKAQFIQVVEENQSLKNQMVSLEEQLRKSRCDNAKLLRELKRFNENNDRIKLNN